MDKGNYCLDGWGHLSGILICKPLTAVAYLCHLVVTKGRGPGAVAMMCLGEQCFMEHVRPAFANAVTASVLDWLETTNELHGTPLVNGEKVC